MTNINVYDDTAEELEKVAEKLDITVAELVDQLLEYTSELEPWFDEDIIKAQENN